MTEDYPYLLSPTSVELFNIDNTIIEIPKAIINLKRWAGQAPLNTFGGKPIVDIDEMPMFAELAIMKLFIKSGWQARWIETYGASKKPYHFSQWLDCSLKEQEIDLIQDANVVKVLEEIALINDQSYSGCWDVIGWLNGSIIFAEAKRTKKDKLRSTQNKWIASGLKYGLKPESFLVIEWSF